MADFNLGRSFGAGMALGQGMQQIRKQNALADVFSQHGAGIASGDPAAMNALAGLDPVQAYKLQRQRDSDARSQETHDFNMSAGQERLKMSRESHGTKMELDAARLAQIERQAEAEMREYAAQMSEAERAKTSRETQMALARGKSAFVQGESGVAQWVQEYGGELADAGIDPKAVTVENFPVILKRVQGYSVALSGGQADLSGMVPEQPQFRPATATEAGQYGAQAGQFDTENGRFYPNNPPKSSRIQVGPDGSVSIVEGAGAGAPTLTVDAAKNTGFYIRMKESAETLDELEAQGTRFGQQNLDAVPLGLGNYARDSEFQRFDQARRDFVNAVLRRESGAVISDQEFENANQQYFPVPGDTPEVIAQKRINRRTVMEGVKVGAGQGAAHVDRQDAAAIPQSFLDGVPQGEDASELWEWMTEEDRSVFR